MATITVTNLTSSVVHLHDAYAQVSPGGSHSFDRRIHEVEHLSGLMELYRDGSIDLKIQVSPDELLFRKLMDLVEVTRHWAYQTHQANIPEYVGGFYHFAGSDNDFSPSINWGDPNVAHAAHILFVTGAIPGDEVTITLTGDTIDDNGVSAIGQTVQVVIPAGTPVNSYFETHEKWLGQVSIETTSGTPITCNFGWAKYHDFNNQDFTVLGLECLWDSDSTDATSNIELIHHKAMGWTFQVADEPLPPAPIASRAVDYGAHNAHEIGEGAWKRSNLEVDVDGRDSQGILWRVTSGNAGLGTLSFRSLSLEVTLRKLPPGNLSA